MLYLSYGPPAEKEWVLGRRDLEKGDDDKEGWNVY